ncbi:MAG: heme lyase CcmF/NrfE family subunit [Deltaproteobacteria bacterium]|nr:heme lyase CcmF/NrfE family subunit [Deltaproteobacteria bacterium]
MTEIGHYSLLIAFFVSAYSGIVAFIGVRTNRKDMLASAVNASLTVFGFLTLASAALLYGLITHDFSIEYIARYTSRSLPLVYSITAFYAGQDGSLLLWAWLLSFFTALVIYQNRNKNHALKPYVLSIMMALTFFFVLLIVLVTSPFKTLNPVPLDGNSLNPMLQNPGMIFHPPTLFLGYVGFSVPFAFALAALITGRLGDVWIRTTRNWTMVAWFFLTAGNLLGAQWAYVELGWGGYWAWDPVENASFMPWMLGTAYLHSVMIQEKRGMLKVWNMVLIICTFLLTIFGTFITRSGIIASVHSFGQSSLGYIFLVFLGIVSVLSLILLIIRLPQLKSRNRLDSFLSRESSFLYNNLLIVGIAFTVLWGTLFPVISEAVRGVKITVGAPFFNAVITPIALALLLLTGVCPLIAWRKTSIQKFLKKLLVPAILPLIGTVVLYASGVRSIYALISFTFCIFVTITLLSEFYSGVRARRRMVSENYALALWNLVARNKRRYGGYIVHFGVVLAFLGVSGSAFNMEKQVNLKQGEAVDIKQYTLRYDGLSVFPTANKQTVAASLAVFNNGKMVGRMTPEKSLYKGQDQPTTDVAIQTSYKEDLYVILAGYDKEGVTLKVLINPLVVWLWIGGVIMGLGTLIVILPDRGPGKKELAAA